MKKMILLLGGARSGKSSFAQKIAREIGDEILFVATAEPGDDEMVMRIRQHQAERPKSWRTIEAPLKVGNAIANGWQGEKGVILDCMTVLAGNIVAGEGEKASDTQIEMLLNEEVQGILKTYHRIEATWIIVSNEVGLGVVPAYPMGRIYRDALGRVNQQLGSIADEVLFLVAGLPMKLK